MVLAITRWKPGSSFSTTCWNHSPGTAYFNLKVEANGDIEVDDHHTVEDIGIVLGEAINEALGDKKGIRTDGSCSGAHGRITGHGGRRPIRP